MKKFIALIFSLLCVGMVFVGCSKETEKYFYDVYDYWNSKVQAADDSEFYDQTKNITYNIPNAAALISGEFAELDKYQTIYKSLKSDVQKLSVEFTHDPKLEGKELKNAQNKVTDYKEQLKTYEDEIVDFKNSKHNFETTCSELVGNEVGIIEKDEYKAFLSSYRRLIGSLNDVFSKMYECAKAMFYPGKASGFKTNTERANAIKETIYEAKVLLARDYMYFCYEHNDSTQSQANIDTIFDNYDKVRAIALDYDKLAKEKAEATLPKIDSKIETLATWLNYYKSEVAKIKSEMSEGRFRYNISGLEINNSENAVIKENHEKYLTLINSTMKNLSKTCVDLVAFY